MFLGGAGYIPLSFFYQEVSLYTLLPIILSGLFQGMVLLKLSLNSKRRPLFQSIWMTVGNDFSLWFRKIPQRVNLHKKDKIIGWWKGSEIKFHPEAIRMPINISKSGSAQKSLMLTAMQQRFIGIKNSGVFGEIRIYIYWLSPLIFAILSQFFYITFLLSPYLLPLKKVTEFPAVILIFPAFLILIGSIGFLHWSWQFIVARQNEAFDYLKYTPATVEDHLTYDPQLYSIYKQAHLVKITALIVTVTFSGILFLISILNEYNPPKDENNESCLIISNSIIGTPC